MINQLITFSVQNRITVLVFTLILSVIGWLSFQSLPIDAVPDITNIQVQINTPVDGFAPEQIERTITAPIEAAMNGLEGVSEIRSLTRFGLSQVTVVFEDGVDIPSCLQIFCTMRGHISTWRATVVLLPFLKFLYTECLAPSRNNTHPCKRKCRSRSRRFIPSLRVRNAPA